MGKASGDGRPPPLDLLRVEKPSGQWLRPFTHQGLTTTRERDEEGQGHQSV